MNEKRYAIVLDTRRCIDCKACTVACKAENHVPLGRENHRNWVTEEEVRGQYPNLGQSFTPGQCMHCANAPCKKVCPTSATGRSPEGIITVDDNRCIGCKYCMTACPYDARYYNEEIGAVDKCTFCQHRILAGRVPACVDTCPTKVRVFGDINDPTSEAAKLLAKYPHRVIKASLGTKPHLFYLI
ncbi:4Fe-4S dicluster domain-containing protein [Trichloromonas sp.]|uniref:4Fe-4S dicluster domain-containing protein n=1 Tax=Trichloromonas sp. TaxID=3069249 RepID=UPI003D81A9CD